MQIILYGVEAFFLTETPYAAPYAAYGGRCQEDDPALYFSPQQSPSGHLKCSGPGSCRRHPGTNLLAALGQCQC